MTRTNLGALAQWSFCAIGEMHLLEIPDVGYRSVEIDLICDNLVTARCIAGDQSWIVGHGEGYQELRFAIDQNVSFVLMGEENTDCYIRTRAETQVVAETGEISYTSIEPRQPRASDEVTRMMQIMKLNQMHLTRQMQEQIDAIRAERQPEAVEPPTLQQRQAKAAGIPPEEEPVTEEIEEPKPAKK